MCSAQSGKQKCLDAPTLAQLLVCLPSSTASSRLPSWKVQHSPPSVPRLPSHFPSLIASSSYPFLPLEVGVLNKAKLAGDAVSSQARSVSRTSAEIQFGTF